MSVIGVTAGPPGPRVPADAAGPAQAAVPVRANRTAVVASLERMITGNRLRVRTDEWLGKAPASYMLPSIVLNHQFYQQITTTRAVEMWNPPIRHPEGSAST